MREVRRQMRRGSSQPQLGPSSRPSSVALRRRSVVATRRRQLAGAGLNSRQNAAAVLHDTLVTAAAAYETSVPEPVQRVLSQGDGVVEARTSCWTRLCAHGVWVCLLQLKETTPLIPAEHVLAENSHWKVVGLPVVRVDRLRGTS